MTPDALVSGEEIVGREVELGQLRTAIHAARDRGGLLWVTGMPGVGKSALLRLFAARMRNDPELRVVLVDAAAAASAGNPVASSVAVALREAPDHPIPVSFESRGGIAVGSGRAFVLLVDGVDELFWKAPLLVRREILPLVGSRRVVVVVASWGGAPAGEALVDAGAVRVFPDGLPPLGPDSIRALIRQRLGDGLAAAAPGRAREEWIEWIAWFSRGVPRVVADLHEILRRNATSWRGWRPWEALNDGLVCAGTSFGSRLEPLWQRTYVSAQGTSAWRYDALAPSTHDACVFAVDALARCAEPLTIAELVAHASQRWRAPPNAARLFEDALRLLAPVVHHVTLPGSERAVLLDPLVWWILSHTAAPHIDSSKRKKIPARRLRSEPRGDIVGREAELATLRAAVDMARARGGLVWVSGLPGMGKSALLTLLASRLAAEADPAVRVIHYRTDLGPAQGERLRRLVQQGLAGWSSPPAPASVFPGALATAQAIPSPGPGRAIVLLVDDVDEVSMGDPEFLTRDVLPLTGAAGVVLVVAAWAGPAIALALRAAGAFSVFPEGLPPLSPATLHALVRRRVEELRAERGEDAPEAIAVARAVEEAGGAPLLALAPVDAAFGRTASTPPSLERPAAGNHVQALADARSVTADTLRLSSTQVGYMGDRDTDLPEMCHFIVDILAAAPEPVTIPELAALAGSVSEVEPPLEHVEAAVQLLAPALRKATGRQGEMAVRLHPAFRRATERFHVSDRWWRTGRDGAARLFLARHLARWALDHGSHYGEFAEREEAARLLASSSYVAARLDADAQDDLARLMSEVHEADDLMRRRLAIPDDCDPGEFRDHANINSDEGGFQLHEMPDSWPPWAAWLLAPASDSAWAAGIRALHRELDWSRDPGKFTPRGGAEWLLDDPHPDPVIALEEEERRDASSLATAFRLIRGDAEAVPRERTLRHLRYVLALARHLGAREVLDELHRTELERLRALTGSEPATLDAVALERLRATVAQADPVARPELELELELLPVFAALR